MKLIKYILFTMLGMDKRYCRKCYTLFYTGDNDQKVCNWCVDNAMRGLG